MQTSELVGRYERDGCVRVAALFAPSALAELRQALERYQREVVPHLPEADRTLEADGRTVRNLWRMHEHDPFFATLPCRPEIVQLVKQLVRGDPVLMAVETFNKPARVGSGVPPHQDNAYFCQAPPDVLTVWVAIDAATEANGPIDYLTGSHLLGMLPHRPSGVAGNSIGLVRMPPHRPQEVLRGTLEPGDALIHHCQTIHWSSPNKTDKPRCGLLLVFRAAHTTEDAMLKATYDAARRAQ